MGGPFDCEPNRHFLVSSKSALKERVYFMKKTKNLALVIVIGFLLLGCDAQKSNPKPVSILGINSTMSVEKIREKLTKEGYQCAVDLDVMECKRGANQINAIVGKPNISFNCKALNTCNLSPEIVARQLKDEFSLDDFISREEADDFANFASNQYQKVSGITKSLETTDQVGQIIMVEQTIRTTQTQYKQLVNSTLTSPGNVFVTLSGSTSKPTFK